jgi:hypothetical protein
MTKDDYDMDLDNTTTKQVLESILNILENQEEGIALVGKQEWMETWSKQDNPCVFLSDIQEIKQAMLMNYFQQGTEKVGENTKKVWRFAISGSSNTSNLLNSPRQQSTRSSSTLQST